MYTFEKSLLIAIPAFSLLIALEFFYGHWRGRNTYKNLPDAISSLCSGLTFISSNTIGFGLLVFTYPWVQQHVAIGELSPSQWWIWPLTFVVMDFVAYWVHRWAHVNGFLWSMHMIHHSSEEFNLPVALRQNAFKWLSYNNLLMFPIAMMGVPVEVVAIIYPIHYFMQYWYHTQHIGKLGWLEYVIVTPSQHRIHHAINDIYIDKNYAGIFCWDRLFGTFQEELDEEPPVYGCLGPVRTWNPMTIELRYIARLLRDALFTRHWGDKIRVFTARTGWRPEDVKQRWPSAYVDDYRRLDKYHPHTANWVPIWGLFELMLAVGLALYLFANMASIAPDKFQLYSYVGIVLLSIIALCAALEKRMATVWFGLRALLAIGIFAWLGSWYGLANSLSMLFMGLCLLSVVLSLLAQRVPDPELAPEI